MTKIKVGDRMSAYSVINKDKKFDGTVVYVHPEKRFFTLEFELPGGKFRESFRWPR